MNQPTDEEIAEKVQNGDAHAFGLLVKNYEAKLLRYARKFLFGHDDAADVVQEVFLKAYANIQSFDVNRSFSSWVYRIAHNEFINAIKKKGKEPLPFFDPDTLFPHPLSKDKPDDNFKDQETRRMLDEFLGRLDAKYREPLVLYFFEDLDYQQIAEILHVPTSTVGVRISRGKSQLQQIFKSSPHSHGQ